MYYLFSLKTINLQFEVLSECEDISNVVKVNIYFENQRYTIGQKRI